MASPAPQPCDPTANPAPRCPVPWHPDPMPSLAPCTAWPHGPPAAGRLRRSLASQFIVGNHENTAFVVTEPRRNDSSSDGSRCGTAGTAPTALGLPGGSDPHPAAPAPPGWVRFGTEGCNGSQAWPSEHVQAGHGQGWPGTLLPKDRAEQGALRCPAAHGRDPTVAVPRGGAWLQPDDPH